VIRWLWKIIVGKLECGSRLCQWETIERINLYETPASKLPFAAKFIMRCETCGEIKSEQV
jgi:hypothetical protein